MLGKAPAPVVNHLWPKRIDPEWMVAQHHCRCTVHPHQIRKWGISCSLGQKAMDNSAAAYDLMDDFIVLGATKNDSSVVHDSPKTNTRDNDRQQAATTRRVAKVAGSFGRLKVQRVKSVVDKASRVKRDMDESDNELDVQDTSPFISTIEGMGKKKKANAISRGGRLSNPSNSHEFRDVLRKKEPTDYKDNSRVTTKDFFEPLPESRHKPYMRQKPNTIVDRRKVSVSRKGWGSGGSIRESSEYPDLDQRRRVSNDGGFFSRKSFRDVGCSEYMIECLRKQLFQRPSHIQVILHSCRSSPPEPQPQPLASHQNPTFFSLAS
ncbi:hypothetical protein ABKV19_016168 [Rosa sericea]